MSDWIFHLPSFGRVRIDHNLLRNLSKYRQLNETSPEAGGVLIGKHLVRGGRLVIDQFTPPQIQDIQGRCIFYRSHQHNKIVQKNWVESNKISTYVGLWHTHPQNFPRYSPTDKRDWIKALKKSQYDGKNLFFIIAGLTHVRCWIGTKKIFRTSIQSVGDYKFIK